MAVYFNITSDVLCKVTSGRSCHLNSPNICTVLFSYPLLNQSKTSPISRAFENCSVFVCI